MSGIGTEVGKSYATGYLAREALGKGLKVITQKLVQTGCDSDSISGDILLHRKIMGSKLMPEDRDGTTCPICLPYPASPALAARLAGVTVNLQAADWATSTLRSRYELVFVEGAGGLLVPLHGNYTMLDYAVERNMPLILVTNPALGSINHTLLSLEVCRNRKANVVMLVYNRYNDTSPEITNDTESYLREYLARHHPGCQFREIPVMDI